MYEKPLYRVFILLPNGRQSRSKVYLGKYAEVLFKTQQEAQEACIELARDAGSQKLAWCSFRVAEITEEADLCRIKNKRVPWSPWSPVSVS